mgnify:CR=1 FL=1
MELSWWNLIPSHFDGIAIELGSFPVHWYGLMYLFAFATCYVVITKTNKKENIGLSKEQIDNFFTWIIAGIIIGARLGYVFLKFFFHLKWMPQGFILQEFQECLTMVV